MLSKRLFERWFLLFLVSALGLFFELAVIRWIAGEVRLFSYFKNLPLLAAFLGLAIGFALAGKEFDHLPTFAPRLAIFVMLVLVVGRIASPRILAYPGNADELLWGMADASHWLAWVVFVGITLGFFVLIMLMFIPLGQITGREMARHAPVPAYIVNLLGSLAGIWAFSLLAYVQTPPIIWFGLGMLGIGVYLHRKQLLSRLSLLAFALALIVLLVSGLGKQLFWSPYQRLEIISEQFATRQSDGQQVKTGYALSVQQVFYQTAHDLSPELVADVPDLQEVAFSYNLPYRLKPAGSRVLILGAGMGNDVAAALRNGAAHVDAVEIDPAILALGRRLHPEHPYADPRVTPVVDDARSFLKKSSERYDIISFGLLDSHTLLSGLSSVRLDSFVYTVESFRQVRERLAEDGVATVSFLASTPWIKERLGRMMVEVFGADNVFIYDKLGIITFASGPLSAQDLPQFQLRVWQADPAFDTLPLGTDDWPYLYMRTRQVPAAYWQILLVIGLVCLAWLSRSFPEALRPNWHFWLLGAAFLLIEFKSITELALLFGTTWLVNALAISGVLLMALAANLVVLRSQWVNLRLAYGLLFTSLVISYLFPLEWLVGLPPLARGLFSLLLLSLPFFFAGLIFSESLRRVGETAGPLASNLSGSVAGGILEYGSLWWGIKSLYLIAIALYAAALAVFLAQERRA
ncbi:MAG: hypothetical protein JW850_23190 [Thermoflexales bacterium]|nr:hypothetical protein [Thermoflexales bacterium]